MDTQEKYRAWVRPIVTVAFAMAFVYLTVVGVVKPDAFVATATAVIMFWFKSRDDQK